MLIIGLFSPKPSYQCQLEQINSPHKSGSSTVKITETSFKLAHPPYIKLDNITRRQLRALRWSARVCTPPGAPRNNPVSFAIINFGLGETRFIAIKRAGLLPRWPSESIDIVITRRSSSITIGPARASSRLDYPRGTQMRGAAAR